jgi:type II secretion system protein J
MKQNRNRGFTLLEVIIALTISVAIFVILFAAMRLGYKSQESGNKKEEVTQKMRILDDRITWLIRGVYPFVYADPEKTDEPKLYFEGKDDKIGFVTSSVDSHGKGPEDIGGLKYVSIFQDRKGLQIREKVFFLDDAFDDSGGKVYVLDPEVTDLQFEYYDIPPNEKDGDWVSDWDPTDKQYMPAAVKVKMTFEHDGQKITLPAMVVRISAQKDLTQPQAQTQQPGTPPGTQPGTQPQQSNTGLQ